MTKQIKLKNLLAFILIVLIITSTLVVILAIRDRVKNKVFYDFKADLKDKYSYISNIEASKEGLFTCLGPYYHIFIYLKPDKDYSLEQVEPIFIDIMCATTDETIYNCFKERRGGDLYKLDIIFEVKNEEKFYYCFSSFRENGQFNEWQLDGTDQYYYLEDYLNN